MVRKIEGCMFLEFAKGDAYIMCLLARVREKIATTREFL